MMLDGPLATLPTFEPSTLYSFYPHQLSPRSHVHSTLFPPGSSLPGPSQNQSKSRSAENPKAKAKVTSVRGEPSGIAAEPSRDDIQDAMRRAELRAVMGRRPAGVGLGKEDDEVILEEDTLDHEQHDINMFGHRFLLPYGRRLTQMEMDAAPSPSPSEPDHEHRQEDHDRSMLSPPASPSRRQPQGDLEDDDEDEAGVDLDASIEDLDASVDEGSMEE